MTTFTLRRWHVAAAGMLALAVAMGIGRFAFTPLLPMMLHDGVVDLRGASWLASANYLGYMLGALLCTFQPMLWRRLGWHAAPEPTRLTRAGLVSTCVLTLGMSVYMPAAWPWMRFAAGLASAMVFVFTSGWCLSQLAHMGKPAMGALIYTGPGAGIMLSGLAASAMVADGWRAASGWLCFGVLAIVLTAIVWQVFNPRHTVAAPVAPAAAASGAANGGAHVHGATELGLLTFGYGLAGFGYIITATFLPVIARQTLPGSPWLDLFWPIFGLGVVLGALVASRIRSGDLRLLLAGCYAIQSLGIACGLFSPTLPGFAVGSLLLGFPFTAITFFAMQETRRVRPLSVSAWMGLLTAVYGLGQIAGPPLTAAILAHSTSAARGFEIALEVAALALALGAIVFVVMAKRYPTAHK